LRWTRRQYAPPCIVNGAVSRSYLKRQPRGGPGLGGWGYCLNVTERRRVTRRESP
jgi:hypothetical protein